MLYQKRIWLFTFERFGRNFHSINEYVEFTSAIIAQLVTSHQLPEQIVPL